MLVLSAALLATTVLSAAVPVLLADWLSGEATAPALPVAGLSHG